MVFAENVPIGSFMEKRKLMKSAFLEPTSTTAQLLLFIGNNGKEGDWVKVISTGSTNARKRFSRDIIKMRRKGMIETVFTNGRLTARLTERGRLEYLKLKLVEAEELAEGRVCVIVFDIPEKESRIRKLLRNFLSGNYFILIQKSVWISRFDVAKTMSKLIVFLELEDWVRVFESREVRSPKKSRSGPLQRNNPKPN